MSYTHKAASYVAKLEGGLSEANIGDLRQAMALLKKQHVQSRKGTPSLLVGLMKEAWHEKKVAMNKLAGARKKKEKS